MNVKEIARGEGTSFWQVGTDVYRAPTGSELDTFGLPMGRRWECSFDHWKRFRAVFSWVTDLP